MTRPQPGNDPLDALLREFFTREMPPALRGPEAPNPVRPATPSAGPARVRRGTGIAVAALGLTACGLFLVLALGRGNAPDMPVRDSHVAEHPSPPAPAVASESPENEIAAASPDAERVKPAVTDRPAFDGSRVVTERAEPVARQTVVTPHGTIEQQTVVHWMTVEAIDVSAGMRAEYTLPREVEIELRPSDGVYAESPMTDRTVAMREPLIAPKPARPEEENYLGVFTAVPGPLSQDQPFAPLGGVRGLEVVAVLPGSPAEAAGLQPGDILFAFDGEPLDTIERLRELTRAASPGATTRLDMLRDGQAAFVNVSHGRRAAAAFAGIDRELIFPEGTTLYGVSRLRLDASGRPIVPTVTMPARSPSTVRLLPLTADRFELSRVPGHDAATRWTGTAMELARQIKLAMDVPEGDRERLRDAVAMLSTSQHGDSVRCYVRPQLRADGLRWRVVLTWRDADDRFHLIDFEQAGDDRPTGEPAALTDDPTFVAELDRLPAAVRDVLEAALRRLTLPEAMVRVERVQ